MNKKIKNSIVAQNNSSIKDSSINVNKFDNIEGKIINGTNKIINTQVLTKEKRKSFLYGIFIGVLASLIASLIWHFITKLFE